MNCARSIQDCAILFAFYARPFPYITMGWASETIGFQFEILYSTWVWQIVFKLSAELFTFWSRPFLHITRERATATMASHLKFWIQNEINELYLICAKLYCIFYVLWFFLFCILMETLNQQPSYLRFRIRNCINKLYSIPAQWRCKDHVLCSKSFSIYTKKRLDRPMVKPTYPLWGAYSSSKIHYTSEKGCEYKTLNLQHKWIQIRHSSLGLFWGQIRIGRGLTSPQSVPADV